MSERQIRVIVVGAGFSGIATALALKHAGELHDVTIVDKADEFGGTWRDNIYPGCACDVPSPLYSLRGEPYDWPGFYSSQPAIQDYILSVVRKHGLREHARLGVGVSAQTWDEDLAAWRVTLDDGEELIAEVVINCLGALRIPLFPKIEGLGSFEGPAFHSARWDPDVDVAGKRVGVIGTGASAVQIVPEIATETEHLHVFQRTPAWILPRLERTFSRAERFAIKHIPGALEVLRRGVDAISETQVWPAIRLDDDAQRQVRKTAEWHMRRQIEDPELMKAVTPTITPGCKRLMFSNTYYPALQRDDVTLQTTGITHITPTGVTLEDGSDIALDVIVYATGFDPHHFWRPIDVVGRDGAKLADLWSDAAQAYKTMTVPELPNMFFIAGPNSGTGHTSVLLMAEAGADYVVEALKYLRAGAADWLAPSKKAAEDWSADVARQHEDLVWASGCSAWYLAETGVNDTMYPGTATDYRKMVSRFDIENYDSGRVRVTS